MLHKQILNNYEFNVTIPQIDGYTEFPDNDYNLQDYYNKLSDHRKTKPPVVIILGWMGSEDRHLLKYANLYDKQECITIRYILPISKLFMLPSLSIPPVVEKLFDVIEKLQLKSHPIFFHLLSNNGAWTYFYISKALQTENHKHLVVKGCVFDSCPSPRSIRKAFFAMSRAVKGPFPLNYVVAFGISYYLFWWMIAAYVHSFFKLDFSQVDARNTAPYGCKNEPFRWPQLFIYSKADDLIPYKHVEHYANERESLGVKVIRKEFDSPHVQHQRTYPDEYATTVKDFLRLCMEEEAAET